MKRLFLCLMYMLAILYGKQAYMLWSDDVPFDSSSSGSLSDIAEEVVAVPLQSTGGPQIKKATNIRQEDKDLFLISHQTLYRFDRSGNFICRITDPAVIDVAEYMIDTLRSQLIVLGNVDEVHYYSFDGKLIAKKQLKTDSSDYRVQAIAMHQGFIWAAEESVRTDSATRQMYIEKQLVKYDSSFQQIETHKLVAADLPNRTMNSFFMNLALGVVEDTGMLYASSSPVIPTHLLRDSLLLKHHQMTGGLFGEVGAVPVFPLHFGSRFWLSSYADTDPSQSYVFCFDKNTNKSWLLKDGFCDNFYHTGFISDLHSMDIYNRSYCFTQSGEAVKQSFPLRTPADNPIVFIVKLKV
jgi:hypothetical protein